MRAPPTNHRSTKMQDFEKEITELLDRQQTAFDEYVEAETSAAALQHKTRADKLQRDVHNVATLAQVKRDLAFARLANAVAGLLERAG